MDAPSSEPRAAGALIALTTMVGTIAGAVLGQPTAGLLAGFALGAATALGLWLHDRRREARRGE